MLEGIVRESTGKKSVKALRRDGYLIANLYGKGLENVHAAFKSNEYIRAVKSKETVNFPVSIGGKEYNVVVQDYQVAPITGALVHVDLMIAQANIETKYMVPVRTEGSPIGLKNKGLLFVSKKRLSVTTTIENLPKEIVIEVADLDTGDSVLIRDIKAMDNVRLNDADRVAVLSIIKAK